MARIIGISGKRGSGKDLLGTFLQAYGYERRPFAGALKAAVRRDFGLTEDHTDGALKEQPIAGRCCGSYTPRQVMIEYGQFFRKFDPNYWVNKVLSDLTDNDKIVITDVRFKNEYFAIRKAGGCLVRLERKPELNIYGPSLNDISETDLDDCTDWDVIIPAEYNVTPTDLEDAARRINELYK